MGQTKHTIEIETAKFYGKSDLGIAQNQVGKNPEDKQSPIHTKRP